MTVFIHHPWIPKYTQLANDFAIHDLQHYSVRFDRHLWSWSFPQSLFIWAFSASFATAREKV